MAAPTAVLRTGNIGLPACFSSCCSSRRNFVWCVASMRERSIGGCSLCLPRWSVGAKAVFTEAVPDSHVWPEEKRPSVAHDVFQIDLPVVDLGPVFKLEELIAKGEVAGRDLQALQALQAQKRVVLEQVKFGCAEYGFFQVVNHGIPAHVVEELTGACYPFFEQSSEVKEIAGCEAGTMLGYTSMTKNIPHNPAFRWHEGAGMPPHWQPDKMRHMAERMARAGFGGGIMSAQEISALFAEYGRQAESLALKVMQLVAESLGLPKEYFAGEFTSRENWTEYPRYFTRLNYYPRCPSPDLTLGVPGHTDPDILTILHQDTVGGLQILSRDGETWLGVRPLAGAFVVNAGDVLQMWTNERYLSAEHRVVTNDKSGRLSIAVFVNPHEDTNIAVPPQLVDSQHPLRFKSFKAHDYYKLIATMGIKGRQHLIQQFKLEDVTALPSGGGK